MTPENDWWCRWHEGEDLTILHVDLRPDRDCERRAFAVLDGPERARWKKFLVKDARRQFALCRAALRINLCARLGCSNGDLTFGFLEHGKPFAIVNGARAGASFNVSHSGHHGLIGFSNQQGLGVDLEVRRPGRDFDGIGRMVYSPHERSALTTAKGEAKLRLFYRLWSLKEALIKALGTGFSLNPSRFEVPQPLIGERRSGLFRFPHIPSDTYRLQYLGEPRFSAAFAHRVEAP